MRIPEDDIPQYVDWYRDLLAGSGAAQGLTESQIGAIAEAARPRAYELAAAARAAAEERRAAAERERLQREREAQERRERQRRSTEEARLEALRQRRRKQRVPGIVYLVAVATYFAPSVVGMVFIDGPLLPRGEGVWSTSAREYWPTSVVTFLLGVAVLSIVLGLVFLVRLLRDPRAITGVLALVLVGVVPVAGYLTASPLWASQEAGAAYRLQFTRPNGTECRSADTDCAILTDEDGQALWSARIDGDGITVSRGWEWVGSALVEPMADGYVSGYAVVVDREQVDASVVVAVRDDQGMLGYQLPAMDRLWANAATIGTGIAPVSIGGMLVSRWKDDAVEGWDPLTGVARWTVRCPAKYGGVALTTYLDAGLSGTAPTLECIYGEDQRQFRIDPVTGKLIPPKRGIVN